MRPYQIGVVTWSLRIPGLRETLSAIKNDLGLRLTQVGFMDELFFKDPDSAGEIIQGSELEVSATCVGFGEYGEDYSSIATITRTGGYKHDATWKQRYAKTVAAADLNAALGVRLLSTHVGFVPHDPGDRQYAVMVDRLKQICEALGRRGITLVMETGQERAAALAEFIVKVGYDNIRVNFDPANMILYGVGEPIEAIAVLKEWIVHVHMKDARWSQRPGVDWGEEVVLGAGQADIPGVVAQLREIGYQGPLVIEREGGDDRLGDVKKAIKLLESQGGQR